MKCMYKAGESWGYFSLMYEVFIVPKVHVWYRHCSLGIGIIKSKECTFKRYTDMYVFSCIKQPCITYINQNNLVAFVLWHYSDSKEASTITCYTVQLPGTITLNTVQLPGTITWNTSYLVHCTITWYAVCMNLSIMYSVCHYLLVNYEEIPLLSHKLDL